jgi:DNA-directed RNA polymerase specialized sigma24 family protein
VTEQTLSRARAGDEDAFRELTDRYRRELQLHVYRWFADSSVFPLFGLPRML